MRALSRFTLSVPVLVLTAAFSPLFIVEQALADPPASICCRCTQGTTSYCIQGVTDAPSGACSNVTTSPTFQSLNTANPGVLSGFYCSGDALSSTACSFGAAASVCPSPPHTLAEMPALLRGSSAGAAAAASSTAEQPFVSITPTLGVPIPGLVFSPATKLAGGVTVPFLSQYISAVYRYLITISIITAIVMVVYGGFRYLIGSTRGDVEAGKKRISDAIIGLLLVLSAYTILSIVNPNTLALPELQLTFVEPISDALADAQARDEANGVNAANGQITGACVAPPLQLPQNPPFSFCNYQHIGQSPFARIQMDASLRPSCNMRTGHLNGWCADCSITCNYTGQADTICLGIAGTYHQPVPCGGAFGLYLRALTQRCSEKSLSYLDGLDGLTYGLENWTMDNLPGMLRTFDRNDHAAFVRVFANAGLNDWYHGGTIDSNWFCQHQIQDKGLACTAGFADALRAALREPGFIQTELSTSYEHFLRSVNSNAASRFQSMAGKVMVATWLNNPGSCGNDLAPLESACSGMGEAQKIECYLRVAQQGFACTRNNMQTTCYCRNGQNGATSRATAIGLALDGISRSAPLGTIPPLADILSRCVPAGQ